MDGGGNANVFVAENARGEEVAIKILREESGNGKKAVKRNRKKRIRFKIETEMVVGIQDEIKGVMLDGWLHHLRTGQRYDVDYYDQCEDAERK